MKDAFKLSEQKRRFIADQLSNAEMCSDTELRDHFVKCGVSKEAADAAMLDRSFWQNNIVLGQVWYAGERLPVYKPSF